MSTSSQASLAAAAALQQSMNRTQIYNKLYDYPQKKDHHQESDTAKHVSSQHRRTFTNGFNTIEEADDLR